MLNGMVYVAGLVSGGGWRSLMPRRSDLFDALRMFRYYLGFPFAKLARRQWPHPLFDTKYNALQRAAYFSVPVAGFLSVATGWAIHKPMQLHRLATLFGGYNAARVWHFWLMWNLHPVRRTACDSGLRRWVGHAAQHDRRLVNKSGAGGGRK